MKASISISLQACIVDSLLGMDIDMHRSGGEIKDIALYGSATPCIHAGSHEPGADLPPCHRNMDYEDEDANKGCCEDEYHDQNILEIEVIPDNSQWTAMVQFDVLAIVPVSDIPFEDFEYINPDYLNYKPPLIESDLLIIKQVFII